MTMGPSIEKIYLAKVIAAKTSGLLSTIGSGLIIHDVILRWRRRKENQFLPIVQRIILSMSVADLFTSCFVHFLGTWMVPKGDITISDEKYPIPLAAGNETTCHIQAFIWDLFTIAGCSSNATLATACQYIIVVASTRWHFSHTLHSLLSWFIAIPGCCFEDWLLVCKEKKENELKQWKWQFPLVCLPWILGLVDSFLYVIGFNCYGFTGGWFCGAFVGVDSPHIGWRNWLLTAEVGLINTWIISMMLMLIKFVHTVEKRSSAYRRLVMKKINFIFSSFATSWSDLTRKLLSPGMSKLERNRFKLHGRVFGSF